MYTIIYHLTEVQYTFSKIQYYFFLYVYVIKNFTFQPLPTFFLPIDKMIYYLPYECFYYREKGKSIIYLFSVEDQYHIVFYSKFISVYILFEKFDFFHRTEKLNFISSWVRSTGPIHRYESISNSISKTSVSQHVFLCVLNTKQFFT